MSDDGSKDAGSRKGRGPDGGAARRGPAVVPPTDAPAARPPHQPQPQPQPPTSEVPSAPAQPVQPQPAHGPLVPDEADLPLAKRTEVRDAADRHAGSSTAFELRSTEELSAAAAADRARSEGSASAASPSRPDATGAATAMPASGATLADRVSAFRGATRGRFDAAVLPIAAAAVVLIGAIIFLLASPRDRPARMADARDTVIGQVEGLSGRVAALERRPAAEGLAERIGALETGLRDLSARPVVDAEVRSGLAAAQAAAADAARRVEERIAAAEARSGEATRAAEARATALETRIGEVERAAATRAAEVARAAEERSTALATASREAERRTEARIAQAEATLANRLTGAEQALAARVTAAEQAFAPRLQALDSELNERVAAAGSQVNRRLDEATAALEARLSAQETQVRERVASQEAQLAARIADFQGRLAQAEEAERRLTRLAARGTIQASLEAGRPLGPALAGLGSEVPAALARYRDAAPPTESALRLSFDEAARAARAAAEPQGGTVGENALARLGGLVTVRRGDQVVVGDPVAGELERASRSLDAGDLSGAVARLERLPEPSRRAMAGWIGSARELVEARTALRDVGAAPSGATPAGNRG